MNAVISWKKSDSKRDRVEMNPGSWNSFFFFIHLIEHILKMKRSSIVWKKKKNMSRIPFLELRTKRATSVDGITMLALLGSRKASRGPYSLSSCSAAALIFKMARLRKRILMATWRNPSSVIHLFFSFSFKRTMRRRVKTVNDGFVRARLWKGWPQRSLDRALRPCGQTCLALTFTTQEINSKKRIIKRQMIGS